MTDQKNVPGFGRDFQQIAPHYFCQCLRPKRTYPCYLIIQSLIISSSYLVLVLTPLFDTPLHHNQIMLFALDATCTGALS